MLFELADGGGLPWRSDSSSVTWDDTTPADADEINEYNKITHHTFGGTRPPKRAILSCVDHLTDLINWLLHPEAKERLGTKTSSQVKGHKFFSDFPFEKLLQCEVPSPLQKYAESQLLVLMDRSDDIDDKELLAVPFSPDADQVSWFSAYR